MNPSLYRSLSGKAFRLAGHCVCGVVVCWTLLLPCCAEGARAPTGDAEPSVAAAEVKALLPETVARAGDWPVDRETVWRQIRAKVERALAVEGYVPLALLRHLARPIINRAIEEHLLGQVAEAEGFAPDIGRAAAHVEALETDPGMKGKLDRFLKENGLERTEYLRRLAVRTAIKDWVRQRFVEPREVTDAELRKAYEERKKELGEPEMVTLERVLFPRSAAEGAATNARDMAECVRKAVLEGLALQEAVVKCRGAAADGGGDVDAHYEEQRVPVRSLPGPVAEAVAELPSGAVSTVLELADAYALVRWTERTPARRRTFAEVEDALRANLKEEKGRVLFNEFLGKLLEDAGVVIYPPLEEPTTPWPPPKPDRPQNAIPAAPPAPGAVPAP